LNINKEEIMSQEHAKVIHSKIIHKGFFDFREDTLTDSKGESYSYNCLIAKAEGVVILAEIQKDVFIFTLEYRYPLQKKILSCPGGRLNQGEEPLTAAKRELLEETGYEASTWTTLSPFYPFPSACDQKVYLYLAKDLKKVKKPELDPLEEIEIKILSLQELHKLDFSIYPIDGVLPTALFFRQFCL
jgi:ADP-ribose pyrophosphatase